jgi:hypothetical protein
MISNTVVLGSHEFWLRLLLGAQGGSQISNRREDLEGISACCDEPAKTID